MYRVKGDNDLAYQFANMGKDIPYPEEDSLFVDHNVYNYLFHEEISITGYYMNKHEEGLRACKIIIDSPDSSEDSKKLARMNMKHYVNYFTS
jgi:hypothetical protein